MRVHRALILFAFMHVFAELPFCCCSFRQKLSEECGMHQPQPFDSDLHCKPYKQPLISKRRSNMGKSAKTLK